MGPFGEFFSRKKFNNAEKTETGETDPLSLPVLYVTRKKRKNLFGSVRSAKLFNLGP